MTQSTVAQTGNARRVTRIFNAGLNKRECLEEKEIQIAIPISLMEYFSGIFWS
jgi:hypothetical protein